MLSFGEQLRQERERRSVSLVQVAGETRIATRHLRALEANEFSELPGDVFGRGYVRAYARFLGADAEALVEAYDRQRLIARADHAPIDDRIGEAVRAGARRARRRRFAYLGAAAAGVGLLAALAIPRLLAEEEAGAGEPAPPAVALSSFGAQDADDADDADETVEANETDEADDAGERGKAAEPHEEDDAPEGDEEREPDPVEASDPPAGPPAPEPAAPAAVVAARTPKPAAAAAAVPASRAPRNPADADEPPPSMRLSISESSLRPEGDAACAEGARVWFHTRVLGGRPGDHIEHVWLREGHAVQKVRLRVGSSNWRTRSYKTLGPLRAGAWEVEARADDGAVLARGEFQCPPSGPQIGVPRSDREEESSE